MGSNPIEGTKFMNENVQVGDRIEFRHHEHFVSEGWVMWFNPDETVQVSDNQNMTCQNWVIRKQDILKVCQLV